jgi:hypothetical protein
MLLALLLALLAPFHVDAGPYAGAFRIAPDGAVNWYFATTSLLRLRRLPEPETRAYLDAYLAHLDPNDGIADALPQPTGIYAPVASDSEDAYAATFLSLAARYRAESHDEPWWKAHVGVLSDIAYAKLLTQVKPDGLIRASRTDPTGYLMDNAEDYAGLRAFADALTQTRAHDAAYVRSFVEPLAEAIHRLYDERSLAFRWSDNDPLGPAVPYPACTAQLFPQLLRVTTHRPASDALHLKHARNYAAHCHLSLAQSPHEALLYAVYITLLPAPTRAEQRFVSAARERTPHEDDDLVTVALRDALRTDRNPAARVRRSSS